MQDIKKKRGSFFESLSRRKNFLFTNVGKNLQRAVGKHPTLAAIAYTFKITRFFCFLRNIFLDGFLFVPY
jgi:hypothetical protein